MKIRNKIVSAVLTAVLTAGSFGTAMVTADVTSISASAASTSKKLPAPEELMGIRDYGAVFLNWKRVDGASLYRVYKYDAKKKKYVKYKNVKSTYCYVTGLKENTKYKFKVMTLKKVNGKYVNQGITKAITVRTFLGENERAYNNSGEKIEKKPVKDYSGISWGDPIPDNLVDVYGYKADEVKWRETDGGKFVWIDGGYYFCIQDWAYGGYEHGNSLSMDVVDGESWEEYVNSPDYKPIIWQ